MKRLFGIALMFALVALPTAAHAQRRGHSGPAMTPFGPVTNPTGSAEWRQAGGNPMVYQAIMEQKQAAAQQKLMQQQQAAAQKQQAAYEKWIKAQKALKDKGKPVDPAYQQMLDREVQIKAAAEARAAKIAARKTKTRKTTTPKS